MSEPVIEARNLTRDFGRLRALDWLSLQVWPGHVVALLGPNGAGKSTFLRLTQGLLAPTAGQVRLLGRPSRRLPANLCRRVASVGQDQAPPSWVSLRSLIALQAGASPRFDRPLAEGLCRRRELSLSRPFGSLSKGQRRWVLAALALAAGADVLLLDEPAEGLDPAARRDLYDRIRDCVNDRGTAAVVATHIIGDIERVADDVIIIDRGHVVLHAPLEELREEVRQVELPNTETMPALGDGVSVLGSIRLADTLVAWVRCNGLSDDELRRRAGPHARVRTVGLERLYLTIAEHLSEEARKPTKETA